MKNERLFDALGKMDEELIAEAAPGNKPPKKEKIATWVKWGAMAACVTAIVLTVGVLPLFNKDKEISSGFTLIAYASENGTVVENKLQEGASVPISFFETANGLKGFVFSYNKKSPGEISSTSIMTEGEFPGVLEEIIGLKMSKDKNYVFYIPEQDKEFPYRFMMPYTDEEANLVYFCYLLVEEIEDGYSAVIERMESFERKFEE